MKTMNILPQSLSLRGFVDVIKKCPGCKMSDIVKMTASQIGSVGQMVVGYLQAHPDVDWVYAPYDPAGAVRVNAIVPAGLQDKVKLVSIVSSAQNIDFIRQGRVQVADDAYDNFYADTRSGVKSRAKIRTCFAVDRALAQRPSDSRAAPLDSLPPARHTYRQLAV